MSSPINPIQKNASIRRARSSGTAESIERTEADDRSLPVVLEGSPAVTHDPIVKGPSMFAAQLMGQGGQKRGLRGGPETLGAAKSAYDRTEWSGGADRRARKGGAAKTDV